VSCDDIGAFSHQILGHSRSGEAEKDQVPQSQREIAFVLFVIFLRRRIPRGAGPLIRISALFSIVCCFTLIMARFRAPSEGITAVIVGLTYAELLRRAAPPRLGRPTTT
jgi:hypothetical protein